MNEVVIFTLDKRSYRLPLDVVERVVRAVEVTPLSQAPANVMGVINVQGVTIPVLNMRRCLAHTEREIDPNDQFIMAHVGGHVAGLAVDEVTDVAEPDVPAGTAACDAARPIEADGLMTADEAQMIEAALRTAGRAP
jgi:chemotaxis signal transduction protein